MDKPEDLLSLQLAGSEELRKCFEKHVRATPVDGLRRQPFSNLQSAKVAELADAPDLGSGG
jgi:hypothetical protein